VIISDVYAGDPNTHILEDVGVWHTEKLNMHGLELLVVEVKPSSTIAAPSVTANSCDEATTRLTGNGPKNLAKVRV
jgi:hypothetical protein